MRRALLALLAVAPLAGCGGSRMPGTTTAPDPLAAMRALGVGGKLELLFQEPTWAVVQARWKGKPTAAVLHLVDGSWVADRTGSVNMRVIAPKADMSSSDKPQIAVGLTARAPLVETALWVDGQGLLERGGGTPRRGTIVGTPEKALKPGEHIAVAYGRTKTNGSATAWVFRVG